MGVKPSLISVCHPLLNIWSNKNEMWNQIKIVHHHEDSAGLRAG